MKQIITKLCLYGILSAIYTTITFFGALYPQYGIPEGAVVYEEIESGNRADNKALGTAADTESGIVYKSYFFEKIKSLKEHGKVARIDQAAHDRK